MIDTERLQTAYDRMMSSTAEPGSEQYAAEWQEYLKAGGDRTCLDAGIDTNGWLKCGLCKRKAELTAAWQPFGPDESIRCLTALGSHYRGFPVLKVCGDCEQVISSGQPIPSFEFKSNAFIVQDEKVLQSPF